MTNYQSHYSIGPSFVEHVIVVDCGLAIEKYKRFYYYIAPDSNIFFLFFLFSLASCFHIFICCLCTMHYLIYSFALRIELISFVPIYCNYSTLKVLRFATTSLLVNCVFCYFVTYSDW